MEKQIPGPRFDILPERVIEYGNGSEEQKRAVLEEIAYENIQTGSVEGEDRKYSILGHQSMGWMYSQNHDVRCDDKLLGENVDTPEIVDDVVNKFANQVIYQANSSIDIGNVPRTRTVYHKLLGELSDEQKSDIIKAIENHKEAPGMDDTGAFYLDAEFVKDQRGKQVLELNFKYRMNEREYAEVSERVDYWMSLGK
jgi:hypothetical protein